MFNKDFFPTPDDVIEKMLEGIDLNSRMRILEPSAGKGNILDYIKEKFNAKYVYSGSFFTNMYCIEKDRELQQILLGKGYKLIDNDYLKHKTERKYDLIIMNPPFSEGVKHLYHAMESSPEADIVCLLNKESLVNRYSKEREIVYNQLLGRDAEFIDLGRCFAKSERNTQVEVVMVRIKGQKDKEGYDFSFDFKSTGEKHYSVGDIKNNQLETRNVFDSLVGRYNKIKQLGADYIRLQNEIAFYANGLTANTRFMDDLNKGSYESFVNGLREASWQGVYDETNLANLITQKVRNEIDEAQKNNSVMAFTVENIFSLLSTLTQSLGQIKEKCINEAFDHLTRYYKENRTYIEGWKTNEAWKVNRKCILPWSTLKYSGKRGLSYDRERDFQDIEKALCLISGAEYDKIKEECLTAVCEQQSLETGEWHGSYFFRFKMYKKGTLHIEFKDETLWKKFNLEACKGKNWIGGGFN